MNSQKGIGIPDIEDKGNIQPAAETGTPDEFAASKKLPGYILFNLDIQPGSIGEFSSIIKMVVDKLADLNADLSACDIKLFPVPPEGEEKMAVLSLTVQGVNYNSESRSPRWDNAFLDAFDRLCSQIEKSA